MAIGDAAAAKGLAVYAQTQDLRKGYENDNKRGDELAAEIDARTTGDASKLNKNLIAIQNTEPTTKVVGMLWFADA